MSPGILYVLLSSVFSTSKDLVSKKLAFQVSGSVSALASFGYALPFYVLLILGLYIAGYEDFELGNYFLLYVFLRASADCFAEWLKMSSLVSGDISLVAPFLSLGPLFLIFLSPFITADPITQKEIFALLFILAGTLLIFPRKKAQNGLPVRAVGLAILSSFFMSLNICFDRLAVQEASAPLAGFAMTLLAAVLLLPVCLRKVGIAKDLIAHVGLFTTRGFFEVAFMTCKLLALQYFTAPTVSGLLKISLMLSIVSGNIMFKEGDLLRRSVAGLLVASGILLLIFM